jgi:hypothetical protein
MSRIGRENTMAQTADRMDVILEVGKTRTFAIAHDWPGWCRSGPDEGSALKTLLDFGPCYARALKTTGVRFTAPAAISALVVIERLKGDATTDFGAPSLALPDDTKPIAATELERFQMVLRACWKAFDAAVKEATGRSLRRGPRGGGRDLTKIREHVCDVDAAYLRSLGGKPTPKDEDDLDQALARVRREILATLVAAARGEVSKRGPRGGVRWTSRYFVRRLAWHELDHAWEIEDRAE